MYAGKIVRREGEEKNAFTYQANSINIDCKMNFKKETESI